MYKWSPVSWQNFPCYQPIDYPDNSQLTAILNQIQVLPPLISFEEIQTLKNLIRLAAHGKVFILQAGDCAETFEACRADSIASKLNTLHQMSQILFKQTHKPIIQIGRIAGQYTKPRTILTETCNQQTLPAYRGDLVNNAQFNLHSRTPDPARLLQGYHYAASTLNYIRTHYSVHNINLFDSMPVLGDLKVKPGLFTSHEALNLYFEQALTRQTDRGVWYNAGTHFPWIGMRTAALEGAHLEYARGIDNPIGLKIGPDLSPERLLEIIHHLNPTQDSGRLILISRLGADKIERTLPPLIQAVKRLNYPLAWSCDPMHGNTIVTSSGLKTRYIHAISDELEQAIRIHREFGNNLSGVHLELTGEDVTECIGGKCDIREADLQQAYFSLVDPRLNRLQSLEIAEKIRFSLQPA